MVYLPDNLNAYENLKQPSITTSLQTSQTNISYRHVDSNTQEIEAIAKYAFDNMFKQEASSIKDDSHMLKLKQAQLKKPLPNLPFPTKNKTTLVAAYRSSISPATSLQRNAVLQSMSSELEHQSDVQIEQKAEKIHNKAKDILSTPAKLKFKEIARGKAKVISRIVDQAGDTVKKTAHKVYITATSPGKLAEIHDEYRFNINIKSNCNLTNDDRNYLAIDMTYNAELSRVKQQETFVANTAVGDLESILNKGEDTKDAFGTTSTKLDLKQTSQLASDLLKGSAALHKVGYLHGDLKLDNCLIYKENWAEGRYNLKIADFGKVRQITPDKETFLHTGNARYAAPENKLSKKAEVFSVGLMLIRLFEQPYLDPENNKPTLIPYENDNAPTINKRYGVEKFVVDNPICPQSERKGFFNRIRAGRKFIKAFLYTRFNFSKVSANKQKSEKVIHEYIDALADSMKDTCPNDTRQKLAELLKSMTRSDPRERPTMEQAMKTFSELGLTS